MDDLESTIKEIEKFGKMFEVAKISYYKGYREDNQEAVNLEIQDYGVEGGANRYFIVATNEDGTKRAIGNGGKTIEMALALLHWNDLDR